MQVSVEWQLASCPLQLRSNERADNWCLSHSSTVGLCSNNNFNMTRAVFNIYYIHLVQACVVIMVWGWKMAACSHSSTLKVLWGGSSLQFLHFQKAFLGGFDLCKRTKYPTSWGNECLRSSLLPRYTDGDHSELQDGFYWPVFIYSRMIKLVTNLCLSIFCGVMRFAGSRWSIFFNKTTKRTKSSFSSSVVGKACKK